MCARFYVPFCSVQFIHSVLSDSLRPHGLQHARLPCSSSSPGACSYLSIELVMPSNHLILCHPLLLLSLIFPSIRVFSNESVFCIRCQSIGVSASASVLPMNIQDWFPLGWTGWISLLSKALSRVFSNTTVQKHHFFGAQLSLYSNSHICTWLLEIMALTGSYLEDLTGSPVMALSITWGCRPVLTAETKPVKCFS